MSARLIVSASSELVISFFVRDFDVDKIRVEKRNQKRISNSIFLGKIRRQAKGLNGVFIDIGLDREAYLPYKGMINNGEEEYECNIPTVGSFMLVQVKREPVGDKGAKVSCKVSLPGRFTVYLPNSRGVYVSGKIDKSLKEEFEQLLSPHLRDDGVIVRTSALLARKEDVVNELKKFQKMWKELISIAPKNKVGMIYEELPLYLELVRDYWSCIDEIVVDDVEIWEKITSFLEDFYPEMLTRVRYVKSIDTFFKRYEIDKVLNRIFSKYVWLNGGGFLVIEETEAMTVIDVNSGSGSGDSLEENALRTNLEAAEEIARQVKLRDLGGIIVIDFIDMKDKKNRDIVVDRLKKAFEDEASKVKIYGITHLGLLEMTRKKETRSITRQLSIACPYCRGKGFMKSPEFVVYEIEKELEYLKGKKVELRVNPLLKESVEEFIRKRNLNGWIILREECDTPLDYYEMTYVG